MKQLSLILVVLAILAPAVASAEPGAACSLWPAADDMAIVLTTVLTCGECLDGCSGLWSAYAECRNSGGTERACARQRAEYLLCVADCDDTSCGAGGAGGSGGGGGGGLGTECYISGPSFCPTGCFACIRY